MMQALLRRVVGLIPLVGVSLAAQAPDPSRVAGCYRLDRALIEWQEYVPWSQTSFLARSAVLELRLDTVALAPVPGGRALRPPGLLNDKAYADYARYSYWRTHPGDSVGIVWNNGHSGRVFRLRMQGDTLRGETHYFTDIGPLTPSEPPPWRPIVAVRVVCPTPPD